MDMDIDMNTLREILLFLSNNSSRESSILSNTFSISYCERIEIQNDNSLWNKQIKAKEITQSLNANVKENNTLDKWKIGNSSLTGKQYEVNKALVLNNMLSSESVNKACNKYNLGLQQNFYVVLLVYDIN